MHWPVVAAFIHRKLFLAILLEQFGLSPLMKGGIAGIHLGLVALTLRFQVCL